MRASGWVLLVASWGLILGLAAYCFTRVLRRKGSV